MIPFGPGSQIIKIAVFLFCRQSWKTFQSLAWGNLTWSQKHGFLELDVRSADVVTFLCNGRGNSVHYDCGRMSRIIVDLRVNSAEHTDTRATSTLSHFNSFCIYCYYLWKSLLKIGGIFIRSIYACRGNLLF